MTQTIPFPVYAESIHYDLKELLVASIRRVLCATTSTESPDDILAFAGHCPGMTIPSNFSG